MNNLTIFKPDTEEAFWQTALDDVVLSIKETLKHFKDCRIGLAGGSTPKELYARLAEQDIPWEKIKFILIDERYVPSDHAQSNLKMIRETLFKKIALPPENIISFDTSLPPESSCKEMGRKLIEITLDRFPIFDLIILGAGADGHIASLFEGDPALECSKYASPVHAVNQETELRLTLCLMALRNTSQVLLLLKGESKQPVVDALEGNNPELALTALKELIEKVPTKTLAYT